jgi:hypothetical protein
MVLCLRNLFCALIAVVVFEIGANILKEDKQVVLCGGGVCLALLVASVTTLITVALMFNNTMFGKAGYLTLTLPVKINSLLASKTVSGLIWIFSVYALLIGSLVLWLYQIKTILGDQMTDTIDSLLEIFGVPSVKTITIGIIIACILFAAIILLLVQCMYLSLTLSQIKPISSFGKFGTIALFFVLIGGFLSLSDTISDILPINIIISETSILFTSDSTVTDNTMNFRLTGAIFNILASVVLQFPMTFLINKKINLK